MNKKQAKAMRKGYKEAGTIYWTKDMEKAIRKIHRSRRTWKSLFFIELIIIATSVFLWIR